MFFEKVPMTVWVVKQPNTEDLFNTKKGEGRMVGGNLKISTILSVSFLLLSCLGSSGGGIEPSSASSSSTVIAPTPNAQGELIATVSAADGATISASALNLSTNDPLSQYTAIEIPAGSLSGAAEVKVFEAGSLAVQITPSDFGGVTAVTKAGPTIMIQATGATLTSDVTVSVPYDAAVLALAQPELAVVVLNGTTLEIFTGEQLTIGSRTVSIKIRHFGAFQVVTYAGTVTQQTATVEISSDNLESVVEVAAAAEEEIPEPTVEPTPEPTPTVEPTPEPTPEPEPDPTPTPTSTVEPTPEPEPTPDPTPTPTPTVEPTPDPLQAELQGTWVGVGCTVVDTLSRRGYVVLSGNNYSFIVNTYTGSDCLSQNLVEQRTITDTFSVNQISENGTKTIDFVHTGIAIKEKYLSYCSAGTPQVDGFYNCVNTDLVGLEYFGIYTLTGNTLCFSDAVQGVSNRPSVINPDLCTIKQ